MNKLSFRFPLTALFAVILSGVSGFAQNTTSPYSMYGYGILGDRATSMQRQMGGIGVAMQSGRQVNAVNPASYAAIDSLTFLFDMGADVSMLWSKENGRKERSVGGGLDYITMQFPISKFMGASIGLIPYSSVGYAFGNDIAHGALENQGSGGINEAYIGVAGKFKGFSLGVNVSYDFGNIQNDIYLQPEGQGQSLFEHVMQVRDWNINIGAQYAFRFQSVNKMVIGLTYSPKKTLLGNSWCTIQEMSQETVPDTVGTLKLKNNYYLPHSFAVGVSYTREKYSRLMVEVDASVQKWSDVKYSPIYQASNPDNVVFEGMKFNDRLRIAAGAEFVPKIRGNYAQRIAYRLGAYYNRDYLKLGSDNVHEYGVSCGVGLHTPSDKTMINVGLEWKRRCASNQALLSENYFNVTLGINFNELWFWQRKIR